MAPISSPSNAAVKAARKLARRSGLSADDRSVLVEGPQAVREALPFLQRLFVTGAEADGDLAAAARADGVAVLEVTAAVLAELATTVTPQGLVGVASLPDPTLEAALEDASLVVVLDQVRDPGNAGTVLRSADAAGADAVVLTAGSVDPRNPKAVRASVGSLFHLPVVRGLPAGKVLAGCTAAGLRTVGTAAGAATDYIDADLAGPTALVFGNEAHGLSPSVLAACDEIVAVPLRGGVRRGYSGGAESLNLAATVAVVAYEAARQRRVGGRAGTPQGARKV